MYNRTFWEDRVTEFENRYKVTANPDGTYTHSEAPGEIIQEGTPQNQVNLNNMEEGISAASLALALMQFKQTQDSYEQEAEIHIVDLAMDNLPWPFNNKATTVGLKNLRENVNYGVGVSVISYSGGRLGNITVMDRALNGFKLVHDGSATNVRVGVRVSGGMTGAVYQ